MMRGTVAFLLAAAVLAGCRGAPGGMQGGERPGARSLATACTTRLAAADPESQAIAIAQALYPAAGPGTAAGAVILCPQVPALAVTALQRIAPPPVGAPLLYLARDGGLGQATERELRRLRPRGAAYDGKVQVYLVGEVRAEVLASLRSLGYKVRRFPTNDPVMLADLLDQWRAALTSSHPDEVVVAALDHPRGIALGLGLMGWNVQSGRAFAWVYRDSIPAATVRLLQRRYGRVYLYLAGGQSVISDAVAVGLSRFGPVRRVGGKDLFASGAAAAAFRDFGRDYGWWWGWQRREFGWGITQPGHHFVVASADDLLGAVPALLLGGGGSNGPLLLVRRDEVPPAVAEYLSSLRPPASGPTETVLNHAWIVGDESRVSWETQKQLHRLLMPQSAAGQERQGEGGR